MSHDQDVGRCAGRCSAGVLGGLGPAACAVSMILVAVGVGGSTAAASMAAMTGTAAASGGVLGGLVRSGRG